MIGEDTISAIATPPGTGGVAIIRISGPRSIEIADKIFRGNATVGQFESHRLYYGSVVDEAGEAVDRVLATWMKGPHSYTGEDVVEFHCHGGLINSRKILEITFHWGARPASAGEFTKLAYLNGRMDLTQVEAVADLLTAKTETARRVSASQFMGVLAGCVRQLRKSVIETCSLIELDLDFAEENLINVKRDKVVLSIEQTLEALQRLLSTFTLGQALRTGVVVNLLGKPNVGKSSLLNALSGKYRAIVNDLPGTTRDYIEEQVDLAGIPVTLRDTAGVRRPINSIEASGIEMTIEHSRSADLNLLVVDLSADQDEDDARSLELVRTSGIPFLLVGNKADIAITNRIPAAICVSARTLEGMESLVEKIVERFATDVDLDEPLITRERHKVALETAVDRLKSARDTLVSGVPLEYATPDIRESASSMGEIIGEVSSEEILASVFENFCIGK